MNKNKTSTGIIGFMRIPAQNLINKEDKQRKFLHLLKICYSDLNI